MSCRISLLACLILIGCSGSNASSIVDSTSGTTQESNATDPVETDAGSSSHEEHSDAGALPPSDDGGVATSDAGPAPSTDAGPAPTCMVTLAATKSYGQCPGKGGGTFTGTELAEPMTSARTIVLGSAVCGLLAKGGNDTFTLAAKKGDCLEVDFHSKSAQLHVLGAGINVNAAGDDVSQLRATANGTLSITVSAASTDEYTLMVR